MTTLFFKSKTAAYTYDGTTITQVTDADYPAATVRGVVYLDGRFFVCDPSGIVWQSADEDPTSWAALDFIGAKTESDQAVFIAKYRDYVMVLKEWSIEFFYDAANPTGSILAPVRNMFQLIGCAAEGSVKETAGTVLWIGNRRDGFGRSVYAMQGEAPQKISTPQVDKILDSVDLSTVTSWTAKLGPHEFYGINLSTVSLALDIPTGLWSVFTYLTASGTTKTVTAITAVGVCTSTAHGYSDGDIIKIASANADWNGFHVVTDVSANAFSIQGTGAVFSGSATAEKHTEGAFPIKNSISCGGKQIMQADGKLMEFSQSATVDDVGAIAARVRTIKFDNGDAKNKSIGRVEIIGDKVGSSAVMRYSDDDFTTNSKFRQVSLSQNRSRLRRMGAFNRRSFEILHVGDTLVRLEALEIE